MSLLIRVIQTVQCMILHYLLYFFQFFVHTNFHNHSGFLTGSEPVKKIGLYGLDSYFYKIFGILLENTGHFVAIFRQSNTGFY